MQSNAMSPRRELAARIRLQKPQASEREVLLDAGYAPSTARAVKRNNLNTRMLATELTRREQSLTPSVARTVALDYLHGVLEQAERPEVKVVAAKQLLDYGMNAPELEPELSGRDARMWKRQEQRKLRLRTLRAAQRMGTEWVARYLAARLDATTSSGETPPSESNESPASNVKVR